MNPMNQQESEALAQFCADQYFAFDPQAWHRRSLYDLNASTVAAMYLTMTSWYGHEHELERVAAGALGFHANGEACQRTAQQSSSFDPAPFSAMVRSEIAARRVGAPSPARAAPEYRNAVA